MESSSSSFLPSIGQNLTDAVCSDPAQKILGSRATSVFEEPSSGFERFFLKLVCVRLTLLTLLLLPLSLPVSATCLVPAPALFPLWDEFPSGRCQPCHTWNHNPSVPGMKGKRLRQVQPVQCSTKSSQGMLLGKAAPGAEAQPSSVHEGLRHCNPMWQRPAPTSWPEVWSLVFQTPGCCKGSESLSIDIIVSQKTRLDCAFFIGVTSSVSEKSCTFSLYSSTFERLKQAEILFLLMVSALPELTVSFFFSLFIISSYLFIIEECSDKK